MSEVLVESPNSSSLPGGRALRGALCALVCLFIAQAASAQSSLVVSSSYAIGPSDLIYVEVADSPALSGEHRVSDSGDIEMRLIGQVHAAGSTTGQLAALIEQRLEADYVEHATVRVQVREVRSKTVSVIGAVEKPGTLGYPGSWSLLEAITAAGGMTAEHGDSIRVLRRADNGLSDQVTIPVAGLIERGEAAYNLPVLAGDLINVERTTQVTINLLGEVGSAGQLVFKSTDRVTLLVAIARAGGLTDRASPRIQIKRRGDDGRLQEIEANYRRILNGEDPDVELEDGDILWVKESFF